MPATKSCWTCFLGNLVAAIVSFFFSEPGSTCNHCSFNFEPSELFFQRCLWEHIFLLQSNVTLQTKPILIFNVFYLKPTWFN